MIAQKYLEPDSIEDWTRNPRKNHAGGSTIWKAVVKYLHILESNLVRNVGSGRRLKVGEDSWMGSVQQHLFPGCTIEDLRQRGIIFLLHLADLVQR